jgi:hypothetical protein
VAAKRKRSPLDSAPPSGEGTPLHYPPPLAGEGRVGASLADERDRLADERERLSDQRERVADERQHQADVRERALDERQRAIEQQELRIRAHGRFVELQGLDSNQSAIDACSGSAARKARS